MTPYPSLVALGVLAAVLVGASPAQGSATDAASTQAYVRADFALVRYASSHLGSAEAAFSSTLSEVRRECPGAAAAGPQNTDSEQLSDEVIGTMVTRAIASGLGQARSFIGRVAPLRWSSHTLTSEVGAYLAKVRTMFTLSPPHLCADVQAWAASAFHALPSATVRFDRVFLGAWVALGYLPTSLSRYESPEAQRLANLAAQMENRLTEFEAGAVERYAQIMDALSLAP